MVVGTIESIEKLDENHETVSQPTAITAGKGFLTLSRENHAGSIQDHSELSIVLSVLGRVEVYENFVLKGDATKMFFTLDCILDGDDIT